MCNMKAEGLHDGRWTAAGRNHSDASDALLHPKGFHGFASLSEPARPDYRAKLISHFAEGLNASLDVDPPHSRYSQWEPEVDDDVPHDSECVQRLDCNPGQVPYS